MRPHVSETILAGDLNARSQYLDVKPNDKCKYLPKFATMRSPTVKDPREVSFI